MVYSCFMTNKKALEVLKSKEFFGTLVIVLLFIISSVLTKQFEVQLQTLVEGYGYFSSAIFYVILTILSVVLAPLNTLFLLPFASMVWGPTIGALLSIVGWTTGSVIAYYLARTFGRPLVERFVDLKKIDNISTAMPKENIFLWIVVARMTVSVDVLSYALGIFLKVPYTTYALATLIGVSPFAFIFAYMLHTSPVFIVAAVFVALIAIFLGIYWVRKAIKNQNTQETH